MRLNKKTEIVIFSSLVLGILVGLLFFLKTEIRQKSFKTIIEEKSLERQENPVTLLVFGDLMLDRYVRQKIKEKGAEYPFAQIKNTLGESDLVLVNLEGPFTNFPPRPLDPNNMVFTFDPSLLSPLKRVGFNLFNLTNNHTLDFGQVGLEQSRKYLLKTGIDYFGDPLNRENISRVKSIGRFKIGFVGYNELSSGFEKVLEEVRNLKKEVDFSVIYAHWGQEYQTNFSKNQQEKAHQLIEAGADVIFGSHPHVVQPIEVYQDKMIFYSLGNFLFDQTFSVETQQGLGVKVVLGRTQVDYYLLPIEIRNFQVNLLTKEKRVSILRKLASQSLVSEEIKRQILEGKITRF